MLPLFESGIPLVKEYLNRLENVTIAYPDEGAWKRFHAQLGEYPEVSQGQIYKENLILSLVRSPNIHQNLCNCIRLHHQKLSHWESLLRTPVQYSSLQTLLNYTSHTTHIANCHQLKFTVLSLYSFTSVC